MTRNIHFFSRNIFVKKREEREKFGLRGNQAMEFAALDLPILPGFIIDSEVAAHLEKSEIRKYLKQYIKKCETETGKIFGDPANPLLVKIVISPTLAIVHYPTLHNFGLTDDTIPGFNKFVGETFGYHEILFLMKGILQIEEKIAELEGRKKEEALLKQKNIQLTEIINSDNKADRFKKVFEEFRPLLPDNFFSDAYVQLEIVLKRISLMLSLDELDDDDAALIVQPMVYGNYGKESASGEFFTRNIVTGDKKLEGWFERNRFNTINMEGQDIIKIGAPYLKELEKVAGIVEDHFREIRSVRFTIENRKVWLVDQRPLMTKSVQADIKTLLDLHKRKIIDSEYLINAIKPEQLNEILHPIINMSSVKNLKKISGGISGAPGAAIGKVYFTTDSLLEAYKSALQKGEETRMILCMPATYAEDVKAIEVAAGVLSTEGGYSAHASVVARQYGKVSLVNPDLKIRGKKATLGDINLKEGDIISLQVPHYGEPNVYLGKADLIEPDPEKSGLIDFVSLVKKNVSDFHVRVNADTPRDSSLAIKFGAEGIGLCRTEHMFFLEDRINVFREMIISDTTEKRNASLRKLKTMQKSDFYQLFKIMDGREVTIRLLDAPLHEFLPHNNDEMKSFISYLKKSAGKNSVSEKDIREQCEALKEFNPMLGHRGCRVAVSYPEIYEMQVEALFEAVFKLRSEGIRVSPEIMIPLIMNEDELKLIIYGKKIEGSSYKGLAQVEKEVRERMKANPVDFKFGTMIELPVAAMAAGEIARYAEFFSFGTNDLTQTTIGLSRDDYNSFMPDYTLYDILAGNPFQVLNKHVKELISIAVRRGTMTRPGLVKGLCGEHGAISENIKFCMDAGLNYVSCSVFSVPIALLAVAQKNIADKKN